MQIILLEKIVNLGQLGEVVRVKDGYARNFLIPSGKARRRPGGAVSQWISVYGSSARKRARLIALSSWRW